MGNLCSEETTDSQPPCGIKDDLNFCWSIWDPLDFSKLVYLHVQLERLGYWTHQI